MSQPDVGATPSTAPIISLVDLRKSFAAHEVLKGISADIPRQSVTSIIGASGSGKSTLLRCINRMEVPTSGRVLLDGEEVGFVTGSRGERLPAPIRVLASQRAEMGMVFQQFNLWPHMTVLQNVMEALLRVRRTPSREARQTAEHFLERVGMQEFANRYPARLSGGQQQRVAIARALAMKPKVMLFDEATSSLDPELTNEVLRTMQSLAEEGMTMIIVTHEMAFAREVSNRVLFLHQGLVEADGPPSEIFDEPASPHLRKFLSTVLFGGVR